MSHKLNITIYYLLVSFDCATLQWPVTAHFIPSELHYLKVDYNNPGLIPKSRTPSFFPSLLLCVVVKYKISHIWHWQTWERLPWWRAGVFWWGWVTGPSSHRGLLLALLWLADLSLSHDQRHSHMVPSNSMMEKRSEAQVPTSDSYWRSALCHPHLVLVMALCTQTDAHTVILLVFETDPVLASDWSVQHSSCAQIHNIVAPITFAISFHCTNYFIE